MTEAVSVKLSGPLFAANVNETVQEAVGKGLLKAALVGQRLVQEQLTPGHGVVTGQFRRSIGGFMKPGSWNEATVRSNSPSEEQMVQTSWLESGPHGRQPIGCFHGYGMFANAETKLNATDFGRELGVETAAKLNGGMSNAVD